MRTKRFLIIFIGLGLFSIGTARAATLLTDSELVGVSGGGVDPHLEGQSLPQEQQQPGNNSPGYTPPQNRLSIDGMDIAPELFAILQSSIDVERKRSLLLNKTTQQNTIAFNLENLLSSDVIAADNIFDGSSLLQHDVFSEVEINQVNDLHQLHRTQGNLYSSIAEHRYEKTVESSSASESYDYLAYSFIDRQNWSETFRIDVIHNFAQVGNQFTSLEEIVSQFLPINIPPVGSPSRYFGYNLDLGLGGVGYTGATYTGVGFVLDEKAQGNDMVLQASITLPAFDLGSIYAYEKFYHGVLYFDFGSIGGGSIPINLPLPDLAPRIEEFNLGTGFAFNGSGQLTMGDPGSISINGNLTCKVTAHTILILDLSKVPLLESIGKHTLLNASVDLFNLDKDFTLLEIKNNPFDILPGDMNGSSEEVNAQDNSITEKYDAIDIAESSFSDSTEHTVFIGGRMTGAEAELLALSEGSLSVDNSSNVMLSDSSQQNMRVINGVNAVSSVAANALNISRMPVFRTTPSAASRSLTTQQNRFNQQM